MYMGVLGCVCLMCVPGVIGRQKRAADPCNWSYRWLLVTLWVLRIEYRSSREQWVLWSPEASPAHPHQFWGVAVGGGCCSSPWNTHTEGHLSLPKYTWAICLSLLDLGVRISAWQSFQKLKIICLLWRRSSSSVNVTLGMYVQNQS